MKLVILFLSFLIVTAAVITTVFVVRNYMSEEPAPEPSPEPVPTPVPATTVEPLANINWITLTNADYAGNDIRSIPNSTAADCQTACAADPNCKGALMGTDGNTCWLKSALVPNTISNNRVLYVPRGKGSIAGFDYAGNDISMIPNSTLESCGKACLDNSQCVGGTFGTDVKGCWLKSKLVASGRNVNRITMV
jgi:Na+-transporting methylmalonyl-CoA/oxaloacetate decarboxylase gamma subunit